MPSRERVKRLKHIEEKEAREIPDDIVGSISEYVGNSEDLANSITERGRFAKVNTQFSRTINQNHEFLEGRKLVNQSVKMYDNFVRELEETRPATEDNNNSSEYSAGAAEYLSNNMHTLIPHLPKSRRDHFFQNTLTSTNDQQSKSVLPNLLVNASFFSDEQNDRTITAIEKAAHDGNCLWELPSAMLLDSTPEKFGIGALSKEQKNRLVKTAEDFGKDADNIEEWKPGSRRMVHIANLLSNAKHFDESQVTMLTDSYLKNRDGVNNDDVRRGEIYRFHNRLDAIGEDNVRRIHDSMTQPNMLISPGLDVKFAAVNFENATQASKNSVFEKIYAMNAEDRSKAIQRFGAKSGHFGSEKLGELFSMISDPNNDKYFADSEQRLNAISGLTNAAQHMTDSQRRKLMEMVVPLKDELLVGLRNKKNFDLEDADFGIPDEAHELASLNNLFDDLARNIEHFDQDQRAQIADYAMAISHNNADNQPVEPFDSFIKVSGPIVRLAMKASELREKDILNSNKLVQVVETANLAVSKIRESEFDYAPVPGLSGTHIQHTARSNSMVVASKLNIQSAHIAPLSETSGEISVLSEPLNRRDRSRSTYGL